MQILGGGSKKLASLYINNSGTSKKLNYAYANINGSKKEIYPAKKYKITYKKYLSYTYESNTYGPGDISYGWDGHIYSSFSFSNSRFYLSGDITSSITSYTEDPNGGTLYEIPDNVNNGVGYFYWKFSTKVICKLWSINNYMGGTNFSFISGWAFSYLVPTSISAPYVEYSNNAVRPSQYSHTDSNGFGYEYEQGSYQDDNGEYNYPDLYKVYDDKVYLTCEEM